MSSWIEELQQNCKTEYGEKPVVITLATAAFSGGAETVDARTVLTRRILSDGRLAITSDARSEKNQQLRLNRAATAIVWLADLRKQFRLDGFVQILSAGDTDPFRRQMWLDSSDSARALFHWPAPGKMRDEFAQFPRSVPANAPIPDSFEVLLLLPTRVETLDLNPHPHLRIRWSMVSDSWISSTINP